MSTFDLEAFERACDEAIAAIGYEQAWSILGHRRDRAAIVKQKLAPQAEFVTGLSIAKGSVDPKDGGPMLKFYSGLGTLRVGVTNPATGVPVNCQCRGGLWEKDNRCP